MDIKLPLLPAQTKALSLMAEGWQYEMEHEHFIKPDKSGWRNISLDAVPKSSLMPLEDMGLIFRDVKGVCTITEKGIALLPTAIEAQEQARKGYTVTFPKDYRFIPVRQNRAGDEKFYFLAMVYNVDKAKARIANRVSHTPDGLVDVLQAWEGSGWMIALEQDYTPVLPYDLSVPIILCYPAIEGDGAFIIDGWHRIKLAYEQGVYKLPCYILDKEDSKAITRRA